MRKLLVLMAALVALASLTGVASADKRLSGKYTKSQVKKDCQAAGGNYGEGNGGSYGCDAPNGNSVICGGSRCYGNCGWKNPDCAFRRGQNGGKGVLGILHAPSAGAKMTGGSAPRKDRRRAPNVGDLKTKAIYRHRSTGPTNPNGPDTGPIGPGGTGPYAPPEHRHTSGKH